MTRYEPVPDYGDRMSRREYEDAVDIGALTSDDGVGHPICPETGLMDTSIDLPSEPLPADTAEVIWFNK